MSPQNDLYGLVVGQLNSEVTRLLNCHSGDPKTLLTFCLPITISLKALQLEFN